MLIFPGEKKPEVFVTFLQQKKQTIIIVVVFVTMFILFAILYYNYWHSKRKSKQIIFIEKRFNASRTKNNNLTSSSTRFTRVASNSHLTVRGAQTKTHSQADKFVTSIDNGTKTADTTKTSDTMKTVDGPKTADTTKTADVSKKAKIIKTVETTKIKSSGKGEITYVSKTAVVTKTSDGSKKAIIIKTVDSKKTIIQKSPGKDKKADRTKSTLKICVKKVKIKKLIRKK